jgi:D-beta-D-heptose 7-phosphate kinase/D-beta-D-heptose 1-phosphate adenosyltransferase
MNSRLAALDSNAIDLVGLNGKKPILVFGDVMLDCYLEGNVSRISPEAPVPVLANPSEERFAVGGAGNVAHNIKTLGNPVKLVSGYGVTKEGSNDNSANILIELFYKRIRNFQIFFCLKYSA